jgi:hypothetical protein
MGSMLTDHHFPHSNHIFVSRPFLTVDAENEKPALMAGFLWAQLIHWRPGRQACASR